MSSFENAFNTLDEMLRYEGYQSFISDKLGNDLFISDPERADRRCEAAEYGSEGSLHCEVIEDWREYLNSVEILDDDFDPEDGDIDDYLIDAYTESRILAEINVCEEWHIQNGSYEQQCG